MTSWNPEAVFPEILVKVSSTFAITVHNPSIIKHKVFKNPALPRIYTAGRTKKREA
jgi:hypothetical protein